MRSMLRWKNVKVGDVLRLEKDDFITVSVDLVCNHTKTWTIVQGTHVHVTQL